MPATPTGRGAQVILTGQVRRAARGAAANSLHGNLDIKTNLELAGSISAGYSPDGRTATLAPAHDITVLAPESELGDALGGGGGGGGPFLPTAGGTVAGPLTVTGQTQLNYTFTQPVLIQGNTGLPVGFSSGTSLALVGVDGLGTAIRSYTFQATNPFTEFGSYGARGTLAAPAAVQNNDVIARFTGHGYNGTAYSNGGYLQLAAAENFGATNTGTSIALWGTPVGATAPAQWVYISNGDVCVGVNADWGYKLDVNCLTQNSRFFVTNATTALIISGLAAATTMPPVPANTEFMIVGAPSGANNRQAMLAANNSINLLSFFKSAGALGTAPTATPAQSIGGIEALGYDTAYTTTPNANIVMASPAVWSATSHPVYITFGTTAINSVTLTEAGRFSPNGNLLLGLTTDGANKLDVVGAVRLNGSLGVFNTTPIAKQTVSGAKGSNAALASLIAALAAYGLITDTTTA